MTEEWRNSEAHVISRGRWTKLNGTDVEILIPGPGVLTGAFGDGVVSPSNVLVRVRRSSSAGANASTPGSGGGQAGVSGGGASGDISLSGGGSSSGLGGGGGGSGR